MVLDKKNKIASTGKMKAAGQIDASAPDSAAMLREKLQSLENRRTLYILFWRLGVPQQDIPDLVSETAYQACRSIGTLRSWDDFERWAVGIARNVYNRYRRDIAVRLRKESRAVESFMVRENHEIDEAVGMKSMIENCLEKLGKLERRIVSYRALQGYKWDEISEFVGKPRSSVARYYEVAIEKLKKCLS